MRRCPAIFVCTPEIVRTWLLYPLWLYTPHHAYPERIIIDRRDYERLRHRAGPGIAKASPYDWATWDYICNCHIPVDWSFDYGDYVKPIEITMKARDIRKRSEREGRIPKDTLREYMAKSFQHWLDFGLEQKMRLLQGGAIYAKAIDATRSRYNDIVASGNLPFEAHLLLERHFAKLLAGLKLKKVVEKKYPGRPVVIFDTGEFAFAAKLLAKYVEDVRPEHFAISQQVDSSFEDNLREEFFRQLGLVLPVPICNPHVADFSSAAAQLGEDQRQGKRIRDIADETEAEFRSLESSYAECLRIIRPASGQILTITSVGSLVFNALRPELTAVGLTSVLNLVFALGWNFFRATECRELIERLTSVGRLRLRLYVEQALSAGGEGWQAFLQHFARMQWPRAAGTRVEEEDKRQQMMEPWVTNKVWYHDQDTRFG